MSKRNGRLEALKADAAIHGLYLDTYGPGDGVIRYRFFTEPADYFAGDGVYTALGYAEALTFVRGFAAGRRQADNSPAKSTLQRIVNLSRHPLFPSMRELPAFDDAVEAACVVLYGEA
jgi:hypothetical protein